MEIAGIKKVNQGRLWDQHMHSSFSGDSSTPARDQIEQAISLGLPGICFTDHCDLDYPYEAGSKVDFTLDFPAYVEEILKLQEEYQDKIPVHLGVEMGLQPHLKEQIRKLVSSYDFDFVIGSTHTSQHKDPGRKSFFVNRTARDAYEEYFKSVLENVTILDDFDTAAHLDYVVRYGPTKNQDYSYELYQELIDPILKVLIQKGKALELNTGGFDCGLGHPNPEEGVLRRFRELGGEMITVGADGHIPSEVGGHFDKARDILLECGFKQYTVFTKRRPSFVKL